MRASPIKIRKSKNTSRDSEVGFQPCARFDNCNTMYSSESQVIEKATSASSSDMAQVSYVPT